MRVQVRITVCDRRQRWLYSDLCETYSSIDGGLGDVWRSTTKRNSEGRAVSLARPVRIVSFRSSFAQNAAGLVEQRMPLVRRD